MDCITVFCSFIYQLINMWIAFNFDYDEKACKKRSTSAWECTKINVCIENQNQKQTVTNKATQKLENVFNKW